MTELTIPKIDVDEFTLVVEDWDIPCGVHESYHDHAGTGPAEWAVWWRWDHACAPTFQYICGGCYNVIVNHPALIIRCRHCEHYWAGPMRHYMARTERIKP